MTVNHDKLKAWREGASAGENCLSLDALERLAEGVPSDPKSAQHAAGCPHCQAELAMLRSFESMLPSKNASEAVQWVAAHLDSEPDMLSSPVPTPFWHTLLRMPNLAGAATLMLVIGLGLSLYVSNRQGRPTLDVQPTDLQNMRSDDVQLESPSGELDRTPEDFRWYALPLAKSYSVQLLEVDGTVLWSKQSAGNVLVVSPELKSKIRPGKQLLWKVTALDASGKPIAQSSQAGFRVMSGRPR